MTEAKRSRMQKPQISRKLVAGLPIVVLVVSWLLGAALGAGVDRALGIAGVLFGIAALLLSVARERDAPVKRVVFLGNGDPVFNSNVLDGLREEISTALPFELTSHSPGIGEQDMAGWQVDHLQSVDVMTADAVVVLPCADDARIWRSVANVTKNGATAVVVDVEPPREFFFGEQLRPPPFVASDFLAGGRLAGGLLARRMHEETAIRAVVALGPDQSGPGVGRSSQVLYEVARQGLLDRVSAAQLPSWDPAAASQTLIAAIAEILGNPQSRVVVFCGDDRILMATHRACTSKSQWAGRVQLVGYDGTQASDGRLIAADHEWCLGTVDTRPRAQGRTAGRILVGAYQRKARGDSEYQVVAPVLLTSDTWI